eukprot:COSAG03_NODE_18423_length_355_cov_0.945312_1_plen_45_part_10
MKCAFPAQMQMATQQPDEINEEFARALNLGAWIRPSSLSLSPHTR